MKIVADKIAAGLREALDAGAIPAATLSALRSGEMVAVPREPTMAMLRAGVHGEPGFYTHSNTAALMAAWRRMLAAAQEAGHE